MTKFLCKVAEVFQLTGRVVVVSDTLYDQFDTRSFRHGSIVELRRPDGTSLKTKTWHERYAPTNSARPMAFSVENSLSKSDIPSGTEVWLVQEDAGDGTSEIDHPVSAGSGSV